MQGKKPKIIIIVGPTASGKSSLAVWLARNLEYEEKSSGTRRQGARTRDVLKRTVSGSSDADNDVAEDFNHALGEVISADSRQIYKHLDLGTAKITEAEKEDVLHHLIDIREPDQIYTVSEWVSDTQKLIGEISARGHVPIIAGGTMQYVDALLGKQTPARVPPNIPLRAELERLDTKTLFALLMEKDPRRARDIDRHNPRRLVRALEIVERLGAVPATTPSESPYDALIVGLELHRDILKEKIITRLHERIDKGLVEETKVVLEKYATPERLYEIGLEYRVVMEYLDGAITEQAMRTKLEEKVWQYAKRQLTWLRKMDGVQRFNPEAQKDILTTAQTFLET